MNKLKFTKTITLSLASLLAIASTVNAQEAIPHADNTMQLDPIRVYGSHNSQTIRNSVNNMFDRSRSSSFIDGSMLQNLNPVNIYDTIRYNSVGIINGLGGGNRFGGSTKIRAFGNWGSATSIDGLPAFQTSAQEGGGYTGTMIPSIAIETVQVRRGSQGVQFGDGTDSGTIVTRIKSGANYRNHAAISLDYSTVDEIQVQAEAAHGWEEGDYYISGRWLDGSYADDTANLEAQSVKGMVGKVGWNISNNTRVESYIIYDNSKPEIFRKEKVNKIDTKSLVVAISVDHQINDNASLQAGYVYTDTGMEWPDRNRERDTDSDILFINGFMTSKILPTVSYLGSVGFESLMVDKQRDGKWFNQFDDWSVKSANTFIFSDNLAINLGLRNTWFDNEIKYQGEVQDDNLATDNLLSYELGASYSFTNEFRLRTSAASGYNRFSSKYGNFGTDALNPDGATDEVVESQTIEIGANYGWNGGYVDLAIYDLVQDGVPRRVGSSEDDTNKIESMEVDQNGIEIELFTALTEQLSLSAGYTHILDLEAKRADGTKVNGNIFWGGQVAPVPTDQLSLRLNHNLNNDWSFWGAGFYNSGFERTDADGVTTDYRAYERLDLGTNWRYNDKLMIRVRVENVTDEKDFGSTKDGESVNEDGKIGRAFWLGIDYKI